MADGGLRGVLENRVVRVGDPAPDFQLPALISGVKKTFRLSQYRGQSSVVLAFYPFNWQETSARQFSEYQAQRETVVAAHAETAGITVESIMNITAWERQIGPIDFPLCSDFWPHGKVAARYGVLQPSGAAERALFVVDPAGRIAFQKTYPADSVPPVDDFLGVLQQLS
jgi:peroxiredoxin (alkyl hydroperoxide reductase subunit C)